MLNQEQLNRLARIRKEHWKKISPLYIYSLIFKGEVLIGDSVDNGSYAYRFLTDQQRFIESAINNPFNFYDIPMNNQDGMDFLKSLASSGLDIHDIQFGGLTIRVYCDKGMQQVVDALNNP